MCGICGSVRPGGVLDETAIEKMNGAMVHRGPDDEGVWIDHPRGVMLGHRRLSILDLSSLGRQPMVSASGRFVMVFNGEIYNHLELRLRLDDSGCAPVWGGHSDTETLLACFSTWGVLRTLQAATGMFALALWDRDEKSLTLARDRLGEKPLYYGWQGDVFMFASELKALRAHPRFRGTIDRGALSLLLRHNCIPAPYSIYEGVRKLEAGHYLTLTGPVLRGQGALDPLPYWSLAQVASLGLADPFVGSASEAVDSLDAMLSASVASQMVSDVPLGAFLSGGVDSSAVVSLMQANSSRRVKTFTIGSSTPGYDETAHARAVAAYLGTDHTELQVSAEDALSVIPQLPSIYCEPFGDSSQVPTILVSRLAREHVTVALSGDGGDELFGGYNRYLGALKTWSQLRRVPTPLRRLAAKALISQSPRNWDRLFAAMGVVIPRRLRISTPGDKAHKLAEVLRAEDERAYYRHLTSHWADPSALVIAGHEPQTHVTTGSSWLLGQPRELQMMAMDSLTYLPDDLLVKVDRAAMANSLETRVPLLDHRVVEFAWRLPLDLKIRGGVGKWALREVLYRYVPKSLIERPKMGFGIPIDEWLRGPLREWVDSLINVNRLRHEGFFHPEPINALWQEHLSGTRNRQHQLWTILMFQAWLDRQETYCSNSPRPAAF